MELSQQTHGLQGDAALLLQRMVMRIPAEQPLMGAQRRFDLDVLRQHRDIVHAQAIRRLALGLQKILDAVLGHDARGFLRQRAAQILGSLRKLFRHGFYCSDPLLE